MSDDTGPARDTLYSSMGVRLVNAGVTIPVADFIQQIRSAAGFRASPRQISTAIDGLSEAGHTISVDSVTEVVRASRGSRSQRQRRNAPDWQSLGAALTIQHQDGSPEGQREFIGAARQIAGPHATDALLLQVSLILAGENRKLDASKVGLIARRLAKSAADLTPEQLEEQVLRESRQTSRTSRQSAPRLQSTRRIHDREFEPQTNKPGKRRWKPGGRRRKTIEFRDKPEDRRG